MRVTQREMDENHVRIVQGAARLIRERGVRATSVADAMNDAGLTHGGFYRHFGSKDDLVIESLRSAFDSIVGPLELRQKVEQPARVAGDYRALYLSDDHVANPGLGCPLPAIGSEVARESEPIKAEFSVGIQRILDVFAKAHKGTSVQQQQAAMRALAMLVGAVVLARASDKDTAGRVLKACRKQAAAAI